METKISAVAWQQPLPLSPRPIIFDIPYQSVDIYPVLQDIRSNKSFLHSQKLRDDILEAKKDFLNQSLNNEKSILAPVPAAEPKRTPGKKISFKIKKQSSLYRRNLATPKVTNIPLNKVAELTKKFNEMVDDRNYWEEQQVKMIVKRCDSVCSEHKKPSIVHKNSVKVSRKPSVKTKPNLEATNLVIIKTSRKTSIKKQNGDKSNVVLNKPEKSEEQAQRPTTLNLNLNIPNSIVETSPNGTSVRAAIEIFEKRSSICLPSAIESNQTNPSPKIALKPVIPEKSSAIKKLSNSLGKGKPSSNQEEIPIKSINNYEFEEDKVEVINIPAVLPQRRCDSMYETLNMKKVQSQTLISRSVDNINSEIKKVSALPNSSFLWRDKSPSSASSKSSINTPIQERPELANWNYPDNERKLPPDIPPKPPMTNNVKVIKPKMPLPDESRNKHNDNLADYEEISRPEETILIEETFKSYDEITKPVNDFEMFDNDIICNETTKTTELSAKDSTGDYEEINKEEKIYEELINSSSRIDDGYEPIGNQLENQYSNSKSENIYETLPVLPVKLRRPKQEPLPPRPSQFTKPEETVYNCYESIYTKKEGYYESIYGSQLTTDSGSNRDSILSSDQKTNSLYGQTLPRWDTNSDNTYYKPPSDVSDRSDEWEDVSDNDERENKFIVVRERHKGKKPGWSKHFREQLSKALKESQGPNGDESDHHYESLYTAKEDEDFDYDSFESDTESEASLDKTRSAIIDEEIPNGQLPQPPNNQSYRLMKFAEKNMRKIRRNFTMNLTKSLTLMKKHISKTDNINATSNKEEKRPEIEQKSTRNTYENVENKQLNYAQPVFADSTEEPDKSKSLSRNKGGFLTKFRRSMSLSTESASEVTSNLNGSGKTKSTFYLTEAIDIDSNDKQNDSSDKSLSPVLRPTTRSPLMRPSSPPPPVPITQSDLRKSNRKDGKSSSWYTDSGVFRNNEQPPIKRPNTYWYAEVGLYQPQQNGSSPSTSSAENSGSNLSTPIKPIEISRPVLKSSDFINHDDNETYNNMKNENPYYTESVNSFSSLETKKDESLKQEIQLRLQDEPLYQFYDAAVLESNSYDTSDFDSDNYEDVTEKEVVKSVIKIRPSAMELVSPNRNSICFTKTLWCEIPEVINSSVLSTLSIHQKKLQEAKFEILTSEASYLNSLNVLNNHFVRSFNTSNILSKEDRQVLFGHVEEVRNSSEKLLHDLEKCWQDNILLHGICDIIQKHAEENFNVYIPYCENQILFDDALKHFRERLGFTEFLRHLELSEACQSLSLYSFLMLPMQRITRWPLLVDAVLKRLPQQDSEYYACQFALATVNKIVSQCNEAARQKEREIELLRIAKQLEFPDSLSAIPIITPDRWLVRFGNVTHMQSRNEDTKLTFGKRFSKSTICLFLFNDLFVVAKERSDKNFVVQQYCPRNMVELNTSEVVLVVPAKEAQGKNLIFLTILENHEGKTIEYLLSCSSESDKERWVEALTPPKSEDPEETLYECWDCPQVSAIHNYTASQPDELALMKGDVINVLRKMADGWYHGEKLRDGQTGWFPANHTVEIANFHVRARNLKQRYRLLAFSENYLKSK